MDAKFEVSLFIYTASSWPARIIQKGHVPKTNTIKELKVCHEWWYSTPEIPALRGPKTGKGKSGVGI